MFLLTSISIVSAETEKEEENIKTTEEPKHEYSWPCKVMVLTGLEDVNFTYHPLYKGLISGGTITGTFDENSRLSFSPLSIQYLPLFLWALLGRVFDLDEDDLGIEEGNYIEITFKFACMVDWDINQGSMNFKGIAIGITLKIYDEVPT